MVLENVEDNSALGQFFEHLLNQLEKEFLAIVLLEIIPEGSIKY